MQGFNIVIIGFFLFVNYDKLRLLFPSLFGGRRKYFVDIHLSSKYFPPPSALFSLANIQSP